MDVGIVSYQFSLKKSYAHSNDRFFNLTDKIFGKNKDMDLLDCIYNDIESELEEFNSHIGEETRDGEKVEDEDTSPTLKKALSSGSLIIKDTIKRNSRDFYKYIYFTIKCGEYGAKAELNNLDTGNVDFVQGPRHAPMRPFHILMAMTCDESTEHGIILYERIGTLGIKSILTPRICSVFSNYNLTFKVLPLVQLNYIDELLTRAPLENLRLVKYFENHDKSERPFCTREERVYVKPFLSDYKSKFHNIANNGKASCTGIGVIDDFSPDSIRVTFDVNGRNKTIELTNIDTVNFTEFFSYQDGIQFVDGLPTDDSLLQALQVLINEQISIVS